MEVIMKVLVLNGSPHPNGATTDMVSAFEKGAKEAGHEVITFAVARMNVKGCLGCEYCHIFLCNPLEMQMPLAESE
jgi:multimeric flavodoxin WrbA